MKLQTKLHELVVSFFGRLSDHAIRHPRRVLIVATLVTLAAAPGVLRLKLRTDGHALVPPAAPEVLYDRAIRDQFGIEDNIVVLIRPDHPDGVFNPAALQLVRDLTAEFKTLPGVKPSNVLSLATEPGLRPRPGTVYHLPLLEPPLATKAQLDKLREDLRRIGLYTGTLLANDGKSTAILIGAPSGGDRTRLYRRVQDVIAARQTTNVDITVTGAPVAESLLGLHILEDLGVPQMLLGASTRSHKEQAEWRMPASLYELRLLIARRIGLVPVAVVVMILVFFVSFRNVLATLLPLPEVAATSLFVFGLMGWLGVPIYLTIAVMPVLLTAMCVTDEIHVFSRYFALLRDRPGVDHVELVRETMQEMVCPVANTTLTTAIGFVSFAFSPLRPVQAFGVFTSLGVLFSLFYSLTVIPAMLVLINPERLVSRRRREAGDPGRVAAWFAQFGLGVVRQKGWVVGLMVIVIGLTPLGLRRLVVQDSWIDGFDPASEFRRATRLVNEQFHGMHLLLVSFEPPRVVAGELPASAVTAGKIILPGKLTDDALLLPSNVISFWPAGESPGTSRPNSTPAWQTQIQMASRAGSNIVAWTPDAAADRAGWQALSGSGQLRFELTTRPHYESAVILTLAEFSAFIRERRQYGVGGVLGPAEYLATTRFMARAADLGVRGLPVGGREARLTWDYFRVVLGPHRLRQVVDTNFCQSLTTIFLKDANFIDTAKLMAALRDYEREHFAPKGIKIGFAGDVAVSQSLIKGIVTTQMQSFFWSLLGIYAVTALLGRSLRWGLYCVLPSALAVVVNFALMGWFGIPLGVATSMFAGMTLGIGVDFAIHLLEGYGLAQANGASPTEALSRAMALTGPPVLINTLSISLGFGALILSQVPANARLGLLTVLGLVDCLIASLLLLPVLMHRWRVTDPRASGRSRESGG
jgi:predicted RND superfamily exporter protein